MPTHAIYGAERQTNVPLTTAETCLFPKTEQFSGPPHYRELIIRGHLSSSSYSSSSDDVKAVFVYHFESFILWYIVKQLPFNLDNKKLSLEDGNF